MNDENGHLPPSAPDSDGRGPRGRFAPGNRLSRGNPHARRANLIRAALFKAVKPADIRQAAEALVEQAKGGDRFAFAELLDRTIGRPAPEDLLQRIEALELAHGKAAAGGLNGHG